MNARNNCCTSFTPLLVWKFTIPHLKARHDSFIYAPWHMCISSSFSMQRPSTWLRHSTARHNPFIRAKQLIYMATYLIYMCDMTRLYECCFLSYTAVYSASAFTCATQQRSTTRITQQMHMCVQLSCDSRLSRHFNWVNWLQLSCATQRLSKCVRAKGLIHMASYRIYMCNLTQLYELTAYRQLFDIWVETLWHCVGVSRTGARHSICRGPVCEQRLRLPIFICKYHSYVDHIHM